MRILLFLLTAGYVHSVTIVPVQAPVLSPTNGTVPIAIPVRAPTNINLTAPTIALIQAPVLPPNNVTAPITTPVRVPVTANIAVPAPVSTKSPVLPPTNATASVTTPVQAPVAANITVPTILSVKAPTTAPQTAPISAPVQVNVTAPVKTPVSPPINATVPVTTPVQAPVAANISVPTILFVKAPTNAPKLAPISTPVQVNATAPVKTPVSTPTNATAPISTPVQAPVAANISVPTIVFVKAPTNAPLMAPISTPVQVNATAPVKTPVSPPTNATAPATTPVQAPVAVNISVPTPVSIKSPASVPLTAPILAPVKANVTAPVLPPTNASAPVATNITVPAPIASPTGIRAPVAAPINGTGPIEIRINAGSNVAWQDPSGKVWESDKYHGAKGGMFSLCPLAISGTDLDDIYCSERFYNIWQSPQPFQYVIPVTRAAAYSVKLHFAEIYYTTAGNRIFDVTVNGKMVKQDLDIAKEVGYASALAISTVVQIASGSITIELKQKKENPKISAIEIIEVQNYIPPPTMAPVAAPSNILINVGGNGFIDTKGRQWKADQYFTGGSTYADGSNAITGTIDDSLYQTERYGEFQYNVPVPNGSYEVIMHFAELYWQAPKQRLFNVVLESSVKFSNIDLVAMGNGKRLQALTLKKVITVTDGVVSIALSNASPTRDNPKLSGIEINPFDLSTYVPPPTQAPVAAPLEILINVGGNGFISADTGKEWIADKYFIGGNTYVDGSNSINGTVDDSLYQTERYGEFQYNIPVPNGSYWVVLYFAELYWQGVGQRIFNVQVENTTSYKNLDLVRLGNGKRLQALSQTSVATVSDGFVTITLSNSVPRVDNPKLSGIAIRPALRL